jgi:nitroreductase
MGNLVAQATALDLYVHQMAGIRPDAARETYGIPDEYEPVAGVAVGYLSEDVDERAKMSDRSRRPLRETVFAGSWGAAAPLVDTAENGRR